MSYIDRTLEMVSKRYYYQAEFLQAVKEVLGTLRPLLYEGSVDIVLPDEED